MNLRWHLLLFLLIFGFESSRVALKYRNSAPEVGDHAEVHNIAYSLAHGQGYRFDWDDAGWRKLWAAQNVDGRFDFALARRGSHLTMFRPPLMPILVAGVLRVFPQHSFLAWRILDSFFFSIAACLLCEVAYACGSNCGLIVMLMLVLFDPLRRPFVSSWWTEGMAFDLLCVIVWLLARGNCIRRTNYVLIGGLSLGFLCLNRSMFTPISPLLCIVLATGIKSNRLKSGLWMLAISVVMQLPWWIRNVEVSGRFLPLGTQSGFNLPDEYGDYAFAYHAWTGFGMRDAWASSPLRPAALPKGTTQHSFEKLWPGDPRMQALLYSAVSDTFESELAVNDVGTQAARRWIRANWIHLPGLMVHKIDALFHYRKPVFIVAFLIAAIGFWQMPNHRRLIIQLLLVMVIYMLIISLTHVVYQRFLVPLLPPMYVLATLGIVPVARQVIRKATPAHSASPDIEKRG